MTPVCLDITGIISGVLTGNIDALIRAYLRTNVAVVPGQVLTGFDATTGNALYTSMSSSQWINQPLSSISYPFPLGNVGIGTVSGVVPSAKLEVVGT